MNKRTLLIIGGGCAAVLVLCLCVAGAAIGLGLVGGIGLTQPVADVGESFMQSLKAGNYDAAYGLCHVELQKKIGSARNLRTMVEGGKAQPVKWSFTSRNVDNDQGHMEGSVTMAGGDGTVTLDLAKAGNDWKIIAFDLQPQ
jgi:hypothetical protein